ncbi:MAG: TIM barrel protein, partial [candidate division WOR-3 bacterium]
MRFGFHISIAGGFAKVRGRAEKLGCEAIQLFSSNPRGWAVAALDEEDVVQFRQDIQESNISPVFVHAPYLPNLAATDKTYARKTLDALVQQMDRCRALGIDYLICHVGKAMGTSDQAAMAQVATQLNRILSAAPNQGKVLLENTAGMGSEVG